MTTPSTIPELVEESTRRFGSKVAYLAVGVESAAGLFDAHIDGQLGRRLFPMEFRP
jgi:hypothetical protein